MLFMRGHSQTFQALVVGGGLVGKAAALALTQIGMRVALLAQPASPLAPGARFDSRGVFALSGRQHTDTQLEVRHNARDTASDALWRGIADGRARGQAIADSRRKAEIYAKAAGVTLGSPLSISEEGVAQPTFRARLAVAAAPVPIAQGEETLSITVSVTWAIKQVQ